MNSIEILNTLKLVEDELIIVQNELKTMKMVYFPVRQDPIDNQMAEYINHEVDRSKMRIMFMRESEGVYEFGSRKVAVKVEGGKIQVRVGGGYISIEKFIE